MNDSKERLYFTTKLAFGAGDFGPAIAANLLIFFLLFFFTNVAGIPAGLAGMILAIGKIYDAINDPVIGILSDRTTSRWGRRLPWILGGAIPFGVMFFFHWIVPDFDKIMQLFWYYVVIALLFNTFYTVVNLPYGALTPDLTRDYNERTSLNSFRMSFSLGGGIFSLILAGLIFQQYPDDPQQQYSALGLICGIISIIAILWCGLRVPERAKRPILNQQQKKIVGIGVIILGIGAIAVGLITQQPRLIMLIIGIVTLELTLFGVTMIFAPLESHLRLENNPLHTTEASLSFAQQVKTVLENRPFLYVIGIYLFSWLSVQLTGSILIYFVVSWMGLPSADFPRVALEVQGTALLMLFVWKQVSDRYGKKMVYYLGVSIWIIAQSGLWLIQPEQYNLLYILAILAGCGVSVASLVPWSMLPDVIELDELRTGKRREGIYYSFMVLTQKVCLALALFLVGVMLELAGFIEQTPGGDIPIQPPSALLAIRIVVSILPAIFLVCGLILARFYPITRDFHNQIRLQLQEKNRIL
ncbi:MAG: MFS transporter [Gloeocapsa sp. DLM2.Bin57]|nr:MAG: MFS transporter [Gloeocapsa sp. DLM2.Bin57]